MTLMSMKVPEMSCGHCSGVIQKEVGKLEGVWKVTADPASKVVQIEFADPCTWDEIKRTLIANEFPPESEEIMS
eukprot:CAMPEP_0173380036 /NCGR_PEP_ID=MMETSP1356-20130122/2812_1 /TAXON_ID=77927 ORGANISM="Hemiselmis virescens, Strain PCC157" /NCGR_SAMPLE_ID=MMETSP1356 /ASSEMBLY_ACC=CAM_ASM_000847 /LENGTH=73 /DNA_ID=CAMNT_0014333513 /DNA_START=17 /DNA_END=238 /DNA_ORIENTATION=+